MKLQASDSHYFCGKNIFGNDGFHDMFVYQLNFNMLELKKGKSTKNVIAWKSKVLLKSKLLPLHSAFLTNIKYLSYKTRMQFTPLLL